MATGSKLHKVLSRAHSNKLGSLRKEDGSFTENYGETLNLLAKIHFPSSKVVRTNAVVCRTGPINGDFFESSQIFMDSKIKCSIKSFKPFKSAGTDEIFPALLQEGFCEILPFIKSLFIYSHSLSYIPTNWREANVIYIPKPGNKPLDMVKSYRPITLSSFV